MNSESLKNWLGLAALVVAWGSSFAMTKIAVTHLDAAWIMALRLSIAAAILVPVSFFRGLSLSAPAKVWRKFTWLGFIGHALPFFLITWGTHYVASGVSGLLMGAIPLILVLMAHFMLEDEKLTWPKIMGFLLGFAGIVVLIGPAKLFSLQMSGPALLGEAAILAGCVCYALHAITAKKLGFEQPLKQAAGVCLAAATMGLVFAFLTDPGGLANKPPAAYLAVLGLGILPTALATLLVYPMINRAGPSFVSYSNYLVPVYAVLFGAAVLGEELDWNVLVALLLILAGIAASRYRPLKA